MDKRYKWLMNQQRSGYMDPPAYAPHAHRNSYQPHYNNYARLNHNYNYNKHNVAGPGAPNNYYKHPPPPRPGGGCNVGWPEPAPTPTPVPETGPNSSSDVVTLIVENKNLKSLIVVHLDLMQKQNDSMLAKDKELEEQSGRIKTLLSQNQELMQQVAKLTLTVEDLRKEARRQIKHFANENDDYQFKAKLRHCAEKETQTADSSKLETGLRIDPQQTQLNQTRNVIVTRGEFNGGKKVSTMFLHRVHQVCPTMEVMTGPTIGAEEELGDEGTADVIDTINNGHEYKEVVQQAVVGDVDQGIEDDVEEGVEGTVEEVVESVVEEDLEEVEISNNCTTKNLWQHNTVQKDYQHQIYTTGEAIPESVVPFAHSTPHQLQLEPTYKEKLGLEPIILHEPKVQRKVSDTVQKKDLMDLVERHQQRIELQCQQMLKDRDERPEHAQVQSVEVLSGEARLSVEFDGAILHPINNEKHTITLSSNATAQAKLVESIPNILARKRKSSATAFEANYPVNEISQNYEFPAIKRARIIPKPIYQVPWTPEVAKKSESIPKDIAIVVKQTMQKKKELTKPNDLRNDRDERLRQAAEEDEREEQLELEKQKQLRYKKKVEYDRKLELEKWCADDNELKQLSKEEETMLKLRKHLQKQHKLLQRHSQPQVRVKKSPMQDLIYPPITPASSPTNTSSPKLKTASNNSTATTTATITATTATATTTSTRTATRTVTATTTATTAVTTAATRIATTAAAAATRTATTAASRTSTITSATRTSTITSAIRTATTTLATRTSTITSAIRTSTITSATASATTTTATTVAPTPLTPQSLSSISSSSNSNSSNNTASIYITTTFPYTTRSWEDQEIHCDNEFFIDEADELLAANPSLEIPKWKIIKMAHSSNTKGIEAISDNDFEQRHEKLVREEIERKKRDARFIREALRSEALRSRHNQDEVLVSLDPLPTSTFYPLPEDIQAVQFVNEVPVQAFGENMINNKADSGCFMLPWLCATMGKSAAARAKADAQPVATLSSKKLPTTAAEARHQELNSSYVFLKRRKKQRRR